MSLLQKKLLAIGCAHLGMMLAVAVVYVWVIAPRVETQYRQSMRDNLEWHAASVRNMILAAEARVRNLALKAAQTEGNWGEIQTILQQGDKSPWFDQFYFDDKFGKRHREDGRQVQPGTPLQGELNPLISSGATVVLEVNSVSKKLVLCMSYPIQIGEGPAIGSLTGEIPLSVIVNPTDSGDVPYEILLLQHQRKIAATERLAESPSSAITTNLIGDDWNLDLQRFRYFRNMVGIMNLELLAVVPIGVIHTPGLLLRNLLLALLALSLGVFSGATVYQERLLARRLSKLTETLQIFGASDPSVRATDTAADEVGHLAEAFNCLAEDIAHRQQKLQKLLADAAIPQRPSPSPLSPGHLEQFSGAVAHELKGPLATLRGFLIQAAHQAQAGQWEQASADLLRSQQLALELETTIEVLLNFAKGLPLPSVADSTSFAEEISHVLAWVEQQHREISVTIAPDMPTVLGHPLLWRHVWWNLLQNAVNACADQPFPPLEIGCLRADGETRCYLRDRGRGLMPSELHQIFSSNSPLNSGIGLRFVQQVVTHYGGRVWGESAGLHQGTTIWWTVREV